MKRCPICHLIKPLHGFSRMRSSPDGRHGWCKVCRNAKRRTPESRATRNKSRRKRRITDPEWYAKEQAKKRTPEARERSNVIRRERRRGQPKYRARENERRKTPEYRARKNVQRRTPEYRQKRNEQRRERYHSDDDYRKNEIRRAVIPRKKLFDALTQRDGWVCGRRNGVKGCGEIITIETGEIDHILPVSQEGSDDIDNLQLLCRTCNRKWSSRKEV